MRRIISSAAVIAVLSLAGVGCQNKVYDENVGLRAQNEELQRQLDEANRAKTALAERPAPAPAPAPQPIPAASLNPKPIEAVAPPEPAPAPIPAAHPKPDMGNLEVVHDAVAGTTTVNLPSDVFFSPGQAVLRDEAKKSLTKVISVLKKEYAKKPIRIEGFTDSDPIKKSHWKNNQELSEKRAEAVRDYLASKGISASRITTEGFGEKKPKSATEKSKNRRVELVVLTK